MEEGKTKTIVWDSNSEPPKNYIWAKDDNGFLEFKDGSWVESEELSPKENQVVEFLNTSYTYILPDTDDEINITIGNNIDLLNQIKDGVIFYSYNMSGYDPHKAIVDHIIKGEFCTLGTRSSGPISAQIKIGNNGDIIVTRGQNGFGEQYRITGEIKTYPLFYISKENQNILF